MVSLPNLHDGFSPNFKRPNNNAAHMFPEGCRGVSSMKSREGEPGMLGANLLKENVKMDGVLVSGVKLGENEPGAKGNARVDGVLMSQMKFREREFGMLGANLLKEDSRIDFPRRKYPPPRILKEFPVQRDFPIGCGNNNLMSGDFGKSSADDHGKSKSIVDMDDRGKFIVDINPGKCMVGNERLKVMHGIDSNSMVNNLGKSTEVMIGNINSMLSNCRKSLVNIKPLKVMHGIDSNSLVDMNLGKCRVDVKPFMVMQGIASNSMVDMNLRKSMVDTKSLKVMHGINSNRNKVKKALHSYQEVFSKLVDDVPSANAKIHIRAAVVLRRQFKWINSSKRLGAISGVEKGDMFQWVAELNVVGLHHQFESGIDYMKVNGKILATSVIASGRYSNYVQSSNFLIYSGQGGNPFVKGNRPIDQKLKRGNLALKNSMEAKTPVRVIRGYNISKSSTLIGVSGQKLLKKMYVYDGLYHVDQYWQERGKFGKQVFMFLLERAQPEPEEWGKLMNGCILGGE